MGKTIQVRDVDDRAYTVLRTRAAVENLSLTAYLKRELEAAARLPTMAEWLAKVDRDVPRIEVAVDELGAPLVTCDARLAASNGHQADIELYPRG